MAPVLFLFLSILIAYFISSKKNDRETNPAIAPSIKLRTTKTPTQIPTGSLQSKSSKAQLYPSQVIDLTNWKITLPTGSSENPTEIEQPELANFTIDPWFIVVPGGNGIRFRAAVNGVTTGRSDYPRSELRETTNNGRVKASWSSTSGTHTMFLDQAITAVPKKKKHVVAGQVHDADNDVIVIRLEYPNLYVKVNNKNVRKLDSNYTLGKRFTVKFVVSDGQTKIYYNNSTNPIYTLKKKYSDAYFKTGAYTQSNCSREGFFLCNDDNYGEVVVYNVIVTHE